MKTCAIISEFSPFHNGHKYLIEQLRKQGATHIVCIMSGAFIQRGEPAIYSPYVRAAEAVSNGADLVIELPTVCSLSPAQRFAKGGVFIADSLGCVDFLGFGIETDDEQKIYSAFDDFEEIFDKNSDIIKKYSEAGMSYPSAVYKIAVENKKYNLAELLKSGNNTLALEYMSSLKKINSNIKPLAIKRFGAVHGSDEAVGKFASASYIRNLILNNKINFTEKYVSDKVFSDIYNLSPRKLDELEKIILYKLRISKINDFENIADIGKSGLANRFFVQKNAASLDEFMQSVKTKRYTMSAIKRNIIKLLLGITNQDLTNPVGYGKIIGLNKKGTEILKKAKQTGKILFGTSAAKLAKTGAIAERQAEIDSAACDLAALAEMTEMSDNNKNKTGGLYYTHKIKVL